MEVFVLVKQVPDPEAIVKVKSDTELEIENKYFTNFFDEIAIEAGLKLKEAFGGRVTVLTVDNRKVDALRRGISMGANEAIQITDPALEGSDQFAMPGWLLISKTNPDIILAGRQRWMMSGTGIAVAEGLEHVNAIIRLDAMTRRRGQADMKWSEEIFLPFPPFTCQKGLSTSSPGDERDEGHEGPGSRR
jgi:electron transfer flavoprotein beta subunit